MYSRVTMNLSGAKKRYETLDGKRYIVAPTVMLTEGVHAGTSGPLLYLKEELSKNPMTWNHKPAMLEHPTLNGEGISACSPDVIEAQGLGFLFDTNFDGRLKDETWLDEDKLRRKAPDIHQKIQNNQMVEVSTGLFHEVEKKEGEWNGEKYVGIVRNIQPDHLAILTQDKGACSIADGGGLLRNAATSTDGMSFDDIRSQVSCLLREEHKSRYSDFCYVCDIYAKFAVFECDGKSYKVGYKIKSGKVALDGEPEEVRKVTSYVTSNGRVVRNEEQQGPLGPSLPPPAQHDLSDPMKKQQFEGALKAKYAGIQQTGDWGGWVTEILANHVVYSKDSKLFRLPYTYDDDKIRFDGEPEEVEKYSDYRPKRTTFDDGTQSPYSINQESTMATKAQIDTINRLAELAKRDPAKLTLNAIHQGAHELLHEATHHDAHETDSSRGDSQVRSTAGGSRKDEVNKMISGGHAKEEDRKFLEDLPDDHFAKVSSWVMKGAKEPIQSYSYEGIGDRSNVHSANRGTTMDFINNAPPEMREVLLEGLNSRNAEKDRLIKIITANQGNRFNPEWLKGQALDILRGMASLGGQTRNTAGPTRNYSGQADAPQMFLDPQTITQNQGGGVDDEAEDTLPLPVMNFDKSAS